MITQQQILDYLVQFIDVLIAQAQSTETITEAFMAAGYDKGYGQRRAMQEQWHAWVQALTTGADTPTAPGDFDYRSAPYPTDRAKLYYGLIIGSAFIHRTSGQATILAQLPPKTGHLQDDPRVLPSFVYQMLHSHAYSKVEARLEVFKNKDPLIVPFAQDPDVMQALTEMRADLAANGVNSALVQAIHTDIQAVNARVTTLRSLVRAYKQHVNLEPAINQALQAYCEEHTQTTLNFLTAIEPHVLANVMLDAYRKYIQGKLPPAQQSEVQQLFLQSPELAEQVAHLNEIEKLQHHVDSMKTLAEETQGCPDWLVAGLKAFEESSEYEAVKRAQAERTLATSQDPQEKGAAQQYIAYYDAKQSLLNDCDAYEHHLRAEAKKAIDIRSKKYDSVPIKANVDAELKLYQQQKEQQKLKEQQEQPKQPTGYEQGSSEMQAVGQVLAKLDELETYRTKVQQAKNTDNLLAIGNELQTKTLLSAHRDTFGKAFIAKALTTIFTLGGALVYNRMKTGEFTNFASFDFGPLFESEGAKLKHKAVDVTADLRRKSSSSSLLQNVTPSHPTAGAAPGSFVQPGISPQPVASDDTGLPLMVSGGPMPKDRRVVRINFQPLGPTPSPDAVKSLDKSPEELPKSILKKP